MAAHFEQTLRSVTRYGLPLDVRPLAPTDADRLALFFARLSDTARYQRFMGPKPVVTRRELEWMLDVDHGASESLVAIDPSDGQVVAEARYVQWRERPGVADVAFVVADDWQRQGIATMLTRELVARARTAGVTRLTASTFGDNVAARAVLRNAGFRTCAIGSGTADLVLDLR